MKNFFQKRGRQFLKWVALVLVLVLTALPTVFTDTLFGYAPIIIATFVLLLSFCYINYIKRKIIISTGNGNAECTRGEKVNVCMKLENKSRLVCTKIKADVFISDYFGNEDSLTRTAFSLDSKSVTDFSFDVQMEHVGVYSSGIKNMYVYGLLGVFSSTIPFEDAFTVTVLPQISETETVLANELLTDSPTAVSFSENDGFDYTGVREYSIGDSMKRIHWKLSAHSAGYMTKINEIGKKSDMTVILDMVSEGFSDDQLLHINDKLIETAAALVTEAERKEIDYQLLYVDNDIQLSKLVPRSQSDYAELVRGIATITCKPVEGMSDAETIVNEEMQFSNRSANLIVCTSKVTDGLMQTLVHVKRQQRSAMLYCITDPDLGGKRKKDVASSLKFLEENDIYYKIV